MSDVREASTGGRPDRAVGPRKSGGDDFWPEDRPEKPGGRKFLLIGAAAAVVVAGGAVAAFLVLGGDDGKGKAAGESNGANVKPTVYTPTSSDKGTAKLGSRSADQRPLNDGEVFTPEARTVSYKKYTFTLSGSKVANDCKSVTWGARLQGDLQKYGCTQIVRGVYVGKDKVHVGQFIALNMDKQEGAEQIVRDLDPEVNAGGVVPLTTSAVPKFGAGFSAAYAQSYGHYAVITWVQRAGGAQPASLNEMIDVSIPIEKPADFVWERLSLIDGKN